MENTPEKKTAIEARVVVNYDEPETKPPPLLEVGPIAWVRKNLFSSVFDAVLTLISAALAVSVISSLLSWSITEANWLVVTQNLRLFNAWTYPTSAITRLHVIVYLVSVLTGFTIAVYARAGRNVLIVIGVILALLFAVPVIAVGTLQPTPTILSAGSVEIVSGTSSETPIETQAFVGRAGERIVARLVPNVEADAEIEDVTGFGDRVVLTLRLAAANRLSDIERVDEIERLLNANERLGGNTLSEAQVIELEEELAGLIPEEALAEAADDESLADLAASANPSIAETLAINSAPIAVRILDGATLDLLAEATLESEDQQLDFQLPADGWYVIERSVEAEGVLGLVEFRGVLPLIVSDVSRPVFDENGEPLITSTGRLQTEGVTQYTRVPDRFVTIDQRPQIDEEDLPITQLIDHQFRGERSFADYLTLSISPLFNSYDVSFLIIAIFGVIGYGAASGIKRVAPGKRGAPSAASMTALAGWAGFVFLLFVLASGVANLDGPLLGNLMARFVWVGLMFFIGLNYDASIGRPMLGLGLVMLLGQISFPHIYTATEPLILFADGQLSGWGVSFSFWLELVLWGVVGLSAFNYGAAADELITSEGARRRGLFVTLGLWVLLIVATPLVVNAMAGRGAITNWRAENLLPVADMGLWGGLFLTMMLSVVGIVVSFPIGVLLALGRRAHKYPVVKYACIIYIEFVRGVPLITVLFMASLLLPLVNPALATVEGVIRAMVGITLFSAAYLAENVRGGLQSLPPGQEEAGKAIGLNNVQVIGLIMLPQALRAVIPALVGQAISLFKDTSLVAIVGLADLLGVANAVIAQPEFIGTRPEAFFFISIIYFVFSYIMSFVSRRIEESGSGSARR